MLRGENLEVKPKSLVPAGLVEQLHRHKGEIVALLVQEPIITRLERLREVAGQMDMKPVARTWSDVFPFWNERSSEYINHMLEMWDALGKPELHLNPGVTIFDLRAWFSGPVLTPDLWAVDREIARLDGYDGPPVDGPEGVSVIYPYVERI